MIYLPRVVMTTFAQNQFGNRFKNVYHRIEVAAWLNQVARDHIGIVHDKGKGFVTFSKFHITFNVKLEDDGAMIVVSMKRSKT